jgi:serine protease Do
VVGVAALALCALLAGGVATARELPDFTQLVHRQGPAVVNISTLQRRALGAGRAQAARVDGAPGDDASLGSGLLVSSDGYVLTCAHVVDQASEIVVRLIDRREFSARVVGTDARTDIALLRIDASGLPGALIGDPGALAVGEWVLAIGSPFGFGHSATAGIVSAKGRSLPREPYVPFIQSDVAINPGNSGGPLFNLRGEVVGINSQIYSRDGGFAGVSFAVPIDLAMRVAEQLKRDGRYRRGWLGVSTQEVTRGLAQAYALDRPHGALIADILADGPADRSELRPGDIVIEFAGRTIEQASELPLAVSHTPPQTRVSLRVLRRGAAAREVFVTIGELKGEAREPMIQNAAAAPGLIVGELSEQRRREDGIAGGAVVEAVDVVTRQAGLRPGDVVTEFDGRPVSRAVELRRLLAGVPAGRHAVLRVRRGQQALYVAIASSR